MDTHRLSLQQKIFVVRSFYANDESSAEVRDNFEEAFDVKSTDAFLNIIALVVNLFETTGSVVGNVFLSRNVLVKRSTHQEECSEVQPVASPRVEPGRSSHEDDGGDSSRDMDFEPPESVGKDSADSDNEDLDTEERPDTEENPEKPTQPEAPNQCRICKRFVPARFSIANHEASHFGNWDTTPVPCRLCSEMVPAHRMHVHLVNHSRERVCYLCGKTVTKLSQHLETHDEKRLERLLKCPICPKSFGDVYVLKNHIATHSDVKPHACETCGKRFLRKSQLRIHMRIHTGEKPYTCACCGKSFSQSCGLKSHIQNRHKTEI